MPDRVRIVFASDCPICPDCGQPWCEEHDDHYADCECVGPSSAEDLGYRMEVIDGVLWGIKRMVH